ncbi:allantoinase AllB [Specibacter cremeus]|uniref:allantoinase AllB n=1 Tax=Specibacter cremeus TaxID=1629051 RepID=UPI000F7B9779|nr:allantoinase AllB [Specibacter cremeus]
MPEASDRNDAADFDLVIRGARVLTPAGIGPREVGVRAGVIAAVEPLGTNLAGRELIELADDETLLPGLVDSHVHINEPGRTDWEGFASATRAAAAGGVTTVVDMPLNSIPPTTTVPHLELKRAAATGQAFVDVGFWGGAIPGNTADLRPLHDEGVFGFKCFLIHSGVDEFPHLEADEMERDMAELESFDSLLIVHAEDSRTIEEAPAVPGAHYADFLASRPRGAENTAIAQVIEAARRTGARAHILHLSSSDALPMIAAAKRDGVRLTVETCPHYLTLAAEQIPDGATAFKCCPPIREAGNRELLWQGLEDGTIDCIVSDHSPSTLDLKDLENGDFAVAWGGVSSLQLGLSLIWTDARKRGIALEQVVGWMSAAPANLVGLDGKGRLAAGADADFAVFAADDTFTVEAAKLKHKNPITPYDGQQLTGVVRRTFLRGHEIDGVTPTGTLLRRPVVEPVETPVVEPVETPVVEPVETQAPHVEESRA